ncbi:MAG: hypothetical protein IID33_16740 [Planctomycetes bacterium]|nr:hypothetical protein [Planctomycetota bacterium]
MNADHTPDPGFVDHLEWELKSTMRRRASLNGTSSTLRPVRLRLGAALTLMVLSMLIGGAGANALTRRVDGRSAALYIARGEALLEIARTQLEPLGRELAKTLARVEREVVTEQQLRRIEAQHSQAESDAKIRELELAETRITGKEPNDSLSAPLVGARDFVAERLAQRRSPMRRRLELVLGEARSAQELVDAGASSAGARKAAQIQVGAAEAELSGLEHRNQLRATFLAGELSAVDVELNGMRVAAIAAREIAIGQIEVLAEEYKRITLLSDRGFVSGSELRAVESELRAVEVHVELADLEIRILNQKLQDASGK